MSTALETLQHCHYILSDGSICRNPKVVARGYCGTHYSQLRKANAFTDITPKPRTDKQLVLSNVREVKRARKALLKAAPIFVSNLIEASKNESKRGKSDATRWAILHTRTIDPVSESSNPTHNQTQINIGVKVSGVRRDESE